MMDNCPCCFQPLPDVERVVCDLDYNTVIWRNHCCQLTPTEAEMFTVLLDRSPAWVHIEQLMQRIYGLTTHQPDDKIFNVFKCKINYKLKEADIPIQIDNSWRHGQGASKYRLRH